MADNLTAAAIVVSFRTALSGDAKDTSVPGHITTARCDGRTTSADSRFTEFLDSTGCGLIIPLKGRRRARELRA